MTMQLPEVTTLAMEDVTPYFRNPRRIPPEAIAAVRASIEGYTYLQPLVVDTNHVIVVGHTRYAAAKELGATEIDVYVTDLPDDKVREYRLADNRLSEMSSWDHAALVMELREVETSVLDQFFPDISLELEALGHDDVTEEEVAEAARKIAQPPPASAPPAATTIVVCPACSGEFEVRTESLTDGGAQ